MTSVGLAFWRKGRWLPTVAPPAPRRRVRALADLSGCRDGTAIIEFALALPILFALLAGAFELGRALLVRQAMIEAVRGGARYLARVPDATCRASSCSPGAARALALTRDQILENTGLPRAALSVSSRDDVGAGQVAVRAELRLDVDLLRVFGFGPVITLEASHREPRIAG